MEGGPSPLEYFGQIGLTSSGSCEIRSVTTPLGCKDAYGGASLEQMLEEENLDEANLVEVEHATSLCLVIKTHQTLHARAPCVELETSEIRSGSAGVSTRDARSSGIGRNKNDFSKTLPLTCTTHLLPQSPFIFSRFSLEPPKLLSTVTHQVFPPINLQHRRNVRSAVSYQLDRTVSKTETDLFWKSKVILRIAKR
ncbi:hypothetical protein LR48_Vigan08g012600 [Vigna angularis]|uniref:Uncharacterized protein n=1 Tax=Phaseolus angularis TaxID=3914 RepID=A0A0L9V3H8_PHAAN|nr:hypothetical protein LR48_Vigan08g012600 [Vigna angularis]